MISKGMTVIMDGLHGSGSVLTAARGAIVQTIVVDITDVVANLNSKTIYFLFLRDSRKFMENLNLGISKVLQTYICLDISISCLGSNCTEGCSRYHRRRCQPQQ